MTDPENQLEYHHRQEIDRIADEFEREFRNGQRPSIEAYMEKQPELLRSLLFKELLALDLEFRLAANERPSTLEYFHRFPQLREFVEKVFSGVDVYVTTVQDASAKVLSDEPIPAQLGRYVIQRQLGRGGFGVVYLAHDPQLERLVALKVPRRESFTTEQQVASFIQEARTAAKLKHPLLVAVHDVQEVNGLPYIIQEYINGENLADWAIKKQPSFQQIARILVGVTEALGYAHQQGLTHCDLKLANVLMDQLGQPHVADFGLAIHQDVRARHKGERFGTPAMMAPEQVRGEGHRLDGRTDIWSLGVMFYELLVSQRPFTANTLNELFNEIETLDPRPPRQIDRKVPRELERICLKCLSKRRTDRYSTTDDLREELELWLAQETTVETPRTSVVSASTLPIPDSDSASKPPAKIIPKGLRSFDSEDADFFLQLLPGPRDRDDLPESIRFWKTKIEEADADRTFSVGLIYGPSGCGKSSLVKAGLLPRLSDGVLPIYVEATAADTEVRILKQLRKHLPRVSEGISLPDAFAELRTTGAGRQRKLLVVIDQFEQWLHAHQELKQTQLVDALRQCEGERLQVLLMIRDDFHASVHRLFHELECPLVEGSNYALVDRFDKQHSKKVLIAFGRAYGKLSDEINADEQQFIAQAVDELAEDEKVISVRLSLFADMLKLRPWTVESLRGMGGVSGVGVTFLEETFSSKSAPPSHRAHEAAIRQVLKTLLPEAGTDIKGGMRSLEMLRESSGYQTDARRFDEVMRILDSELRIVTPTDPDGQSKTIVLNRLSTDTSTEPNQLNKQQSLTSTSADERLGQSLYYQLTHDYLVPSLRDWLTRKQRETRKGRAELKLAERASAWSSAKENKQLPTLWEWLNIRTLTDKKDWTNPQRAVMHRATNLHGVRSGLVTLGLIALGTVGWFARTEVVRQQEATRIEGKVRELVNAEPSQLPAIIKELDANQKVATTYLTALVSSNPKTLDEKRSQLHARLAMVSGDPSLRDPLIEELLNNKVVYVGPIREQLRPWAKELTEKFRDILRDEKGDVQRRFRAALALAEYVPESEKAWWTEQDLKFVVEQLVAANAEFQPLLREYLRPMRGQLLEDLEKIFADSKGTDGQRLSAANAFADYAASDIAKLSQLLTLATPEQYSLLYPLVAASPTPTTVEELSKIAATMPTAELGSVERVPFGQRRANAAVTLLRLGEREKVLPVFEMTDDPESLTQFIFRCRPRGVGVDALLDILQLIVESKGGNAIPTRSVSEGHSNNVSARYAILLALGEFTLTEIPESRREPLLKQLSDTYRNDPSSGVHGAAGWLLRQWGQADAVREVDQTSVPYSLDREWFTLAIKVTPKSPPKPKEESGKEKEESDSEPSKPEPPVEPLPPKTFYFTFIVFPSGSSKIGSVDDEPEREKHELRHAATLTRPFALLDREVTMEELIAFDPDYLRYMKQFDRRPEDAGYAADWYDSVSFSRWLGQQSGLPEAEQSYADPETLDKESYPREPDPVANWAPQNWPLELGRRGFRLPTESEWEAVSRSGARTSYGYGSDASMLGRFDWFQDNSGKHVHPPKELRPGQRGLFDVHGNLSEWTHDWYSYYEAEAVTDPLGPKRGSYRVERGGCWDYAAAYCRSAYRFTNAPSSRSIFMGFRLALSPSSNATEAEKSKGAEPAGVGTEGAPAEQRP